MGFTTQPEVFAIKTSNQRPALAVVVKQAGSPLDLTGATATFTLKNRDTGAVKVNAQAANITGATAGELEYRWAAGDTDTPGVYEGEFQITLPGSLALTVPGDSYIEVHVIARLT